MAEATYAIYIDWNNDGDFSDSNENVTSRVLGLRTSLAWSRGRDHPRALSAIAPGQVEFELDNSDALLSPDNSSSALYGSLEPGKNVLIQATFSAVTYDLFRGFIDDYEVKPGRADRSVRFTAMDLLSKFSNAKVKTEVYPSVQSGEAINILLDAIGWPEDDRDIDQGATTFRWWFAQDDNAMDVLGRILDSEGPPSFAYVAPSGNFVFRDRHHRLTHVESSTVQATFRGTGTEPLFSEPMEYEVGWRDIVNEVTITVPEKQPGAIQSVWDTEDTFSLVSGESRVFEMAVEGGFIDAQTPSSSAGDYTVVSGAVTVTMSRTSGGSTTVTVTATSTSVIRGMRLRARPLETAREWLVTTKDPASQTKHGVRSLTDSEPEYAHRHDADAVGQSIIAQRANRLPTVSITVNSGNSTRLTEILERELSDLIHIVESTNTKLDDDFFIERISHDVAQVGKDHRAQFACEKAFFNTTDTPNVFTFGVAGKGFDQGLFTNNGLIPSSLTFILDDATNGVLDSAGLAF